MSNGLTYAQACNLTLGVALTEAQFGNPYTPGSWPDKLIEAFSGTHDMIGGKISGLYDEQGNIKRGMTSAERGSYNNVVTTSAIPVSAPFAAAELLSPEVWNALSILLKGAR